MRNVLPDTNILLSVRLLDLVMRSHAYGLINVVWCDELLDEYERTLVSVRHRSEAQAHSHRSRFIRAAPNGRIDPDLYLHLLPEMTGRDGDDHVIAAAAQGGSADVLLTENIRDFPQPDLGVSCVAMTAGQLFTQIAEEFPVDLAHIVIETSMWLTRPPLTPHQVLDKLVDVGLSGMAAKVRPHLPDPHHSR